MEGLPFRLLSHILYCTAFRNMMTITFLGGDARMSAAARLFAKDVSVRSFCLPAGAPNPQDDLFRALHMTDAVILPLPVTRDGIHPTAGAEHEGKIPPFSVLFSRAADETLFLGGNVPASVAATAVEMGVSLTDYYGSERLLLKNAAATAEAALAMAITALPVVLTGTPVGVIGSGRIARALIPLLRAAGAHVYVYARSAEGRRIAEEMGAAAFPIPEGRPLCLARGLRAVFSTVPAPLFDDAALSSLAEGTPLFDLGGGAVDRAAAARRGIPLPPSGALPGKFSPESAGQFLYDEILFILQEKRGTFL